MDEKPEEVTDKYVTYRIIADLIKDMKNKLDEVMLYISKTEDESGIDNF